MEIKLDLKLKEKISKNKYDKREIILLLNTIKTLKKSISGQVLRIIERNDIIFKIMEKRATNSYRVQFILIIQDNYIIILEILRKKLQKKYIDYINNNINKIFKRNQ